MPVVNCSASSLSQECINDCIRKLPELSESDPVLHIYAHAFVKEVNILLLGYILLFKRRHDRLRGFKVILHLKKNVKPYRLKGVPADEALIEKPQPEKETEEDRRWRSIIGGDFNFVQNNALARTLRQYMGYLYLQAESEIMVVEYGHVMGETTSPIDDIFPVTEDTRANWFTISRRFIPIIWLDPASFELYFKSGIGTRREFQTSVKAVFVNANSDLRVAINKAVQTDFFKTIGNKTLSQIKLARMAFFRALEHGQILNFYLNTESSRNNTLRIARMSNADSWTYFNSVEPVFIELNKKPPIYHFIFATLLSSAFPPERFEADGPERYGADIIDLWGFVKELVYGIQELALNIIEHSDKKGGLITGRVYNYTDYHSLNPNISTLFDTWTKSEEYTQRNKAGSGGEQLKSHSFFDFQVADDGGTGVITKLLADSQELKTAGAPAKEIDSDIKRLESGKIIFDNLLNPNQGLLLNQQAKRATAHFGLLTLAKLIEGNGGLLLGGTWTKTSLEKERRRYVNLPDETVPENSLIDLGTNYHIVLPVNPKKKYKPRYLQEDENDVPGDSRAYIEGIERLFGYRVTRTAELPLNAPYDEDIPILIVNLDQSVKADPLKEYWEAFPLRSRQATEETAKNGFIVALDMDGVNIDHGKLFRFIGNWELEYTGIPLIIFNFPTETYLRLLELNNLYITSQQIPFWNKASLVTFYSYITKSESEERFFYTDVLWGKTTTEFMGVNVKLSRVAYNGLSIDMHGRGSSVSEWLDRKDWPSEPLLSGQQLNQLDKFGIFDANGMILPFDILITRSDENSLFNSNAKILLQNEIRTDKEFRESSGYGVSDFYKGLQGYKITDSHFRIGSKIHISDFYYAKRFFQNSFFASPLAFMLAIDILQNLRNPSPELQKRGPVNELTLMGYGRHAELLLSLTARFLQRAVGLKLDKRRISVNYDLLNEVGDGHFLKNEMLYENVVVINPIASTFSSSIKVEEAVFKKNKQSYIFGPHLNLVYVYNTNDKTREKLSDYFGLYEQKLDERSVKVKLFSNISPREETTARFYLTLPTLWFAVENCEKCFPQPDERLVEERALYITDDTLVTPALIFGYPKGRDISPENKGYTIDAACIKYGHYWHNGAHYLFYIDIEHFFKLNRENVETWLRKLAKKDFNNYGAVVIISPNHYTNAGFLNAVNEIVFSNAATIIHYDPESDFIQNFQLFYDKELNFGNKRVIFVDDILTTGSAFLKTEHLLHRTRSNSPGFDAAILLMNRSDYYSNKNVTEKFLDPEQVYSFADIQLPSVKTTGGRCPICIEEERYEDLVANSFLDRVKFHFLEQSAKIAPNRNPLLPKNIIAEAKRSLDNEGVAGVRLKHATLDDPDRYVRRLDAINRIYQWFSVPSNEELFESFSSFDGWKKELLKTTDSPFAGSDLRKHDSPAPRADGKYRSGNASDALLKVLTQSPFTGFKPIREKVFQWVLSYLTALVYDWETSADNEAKLNNENFRTIKFLIRRAGQLNANYLISAPFFELLRALYGKQGIGDLINQESDNIARAQIEYDHEKVRQPYSAIKIKDALDKLNYANSRHTNLRNFNVFFTAQVKELLFLNESRSIHLEQLLNNIDTGNGTFPLFTQLLRILREENGILLRKFWDYFSDKYPKGEDGKIDFETSSLGVKLTERNIEKHYRSQTLRQFLAVGSSEKTPFPDDRFKNYLWLMNYLSNEQSFKGVSLSDKTEIITDRLRAIAFSGKDVPNGAFFIVEYEQQVSDIIEEQQISDNCFVAYNDGTGRKMEEALWRSEAYRYIDSFLNGEKNNTGQSAKTIIELYFNGKEWTDIYRTGEEEAIGINPKLLPGYNHLLLLRLNKRKLAECALAQDIIEHRDHPLGVLGFFYHLESEPASLDIVNTRYLLLLRDKIAEFIIGHHENNEFKDWMEADRMRRAALLTGHGREMLVSVANHHFENGPPRTYKDIVATIQMIQGFIIDIEREQKLYEHIVCTFKKFFSADVDLSADYFDPHIKQMIQDVYDLDAIENKDLVYPEVSCHADLKFRFSKKLLDLFLFELFVNAKKNRWLEKKTFYNEVTVSVTQADESIKILISNTGPTVDEKTIEQLNLPHNTKKKDNASGIYLIKRVLKLFKLGEIRFHESTWIADERSWFNVELTLNTWHVEDKCFTD